MLGSGFKKVVLFLVVFAGLFILIGCDSPGPTTYTLTVQISGQGVVNPVQGTHTYDEGAVVDITATPLSGYEFKEWVGDVANKASANTTVLMNRNQTVRAVFGKEDDNGATPGNPGEQTSHNANGINFDMRLAPASTFPTLTDDSGSATVDHYFWIAETQVTYELWYEVRMWALNNGYTFANEGREGSHGSIGEAPSNRRNEPVTTVSWFDSIAWCNALSEYLGFAPVYTIAGEVIKDATGIRREDVVAKDRDGFRLPTSMEWELAARYKGSDSSHGAIEYPSGSGNFWTPGNYASGATGPAWLGDWDGEPGDIEATKTAAWYGENSDVDGSGGKTQEVGQKPPGGNGLGVYDMSGNVWEWCITQNGSSWEVRGGSWGNYPFSLQVGFVFSLTMSISNHNFGLRFLRTYN